MRRGDVARAGSRRLRDRWRSRPWRLLALAIAASAILTASSVPALAHHGVDAGRDGRQPASRSDLLLQRSAPTVEAGADGRVDRSRGRAGRADVDLALAAAVATQATTLVQTIDTSKWSPASPDPAGITYRPSIDRLIVVDSEVDERTGAGYHGVNLWEIRRTGAVTDTGTTDAYTKEPTGAGFDPGSETLFVSTDTGDRIWVVRAGGDGRFGTNDDARSMIDAGAYGLSDTEDPAFDRSTGHLFFVDGASARVYELDPVNGVFGDGNDSVSHFDVGQYGARDTEALAWHPTRNTLLVGDRPSRLIYEVTKNGDLVRIIDASGTAGMKRISGMTVAPASVDPSEMNIWIVDRAIDNDSQSSENDGKLFELSDGLGGGGTPTNTPPTVSAGANQTITLPNAVTLDGTVTDDGLPNPPGVTTSLWSKVSGPGIVTFQDAASTDTTATFSIDGTYVLRLTADDSAASRSDDVSVTVQPEGGGGGGGTGNVIDVAIASGADDVEEKGTGRVRPASGDLELVFDGSNQVIGLRFTGVSIPAGATIENAYVQFRADEAGSTATSLVVNGEAADDAAPFDTTVRWNVSSRARTTAGVAWSPVAWSAAGVAGPEQRTPNLAAVVQQIVSRQGWSSGNDLVLIISGTGKRTADSFEGKWPPVLHVEFQTG